MLAGNAVLLLAVHASEKVEIRATHGYTSDRVVLRGELHRPRGAGTFPAVVLMHGCGGWQPAVRFTLTAYARLLAANGFVVLDLDSFGPRNLGNGPVCESVERQQEALDYRTDDAYDALRYLQSRDDVDATKVFLVGQSNGGSVAINVAKGDHRAAGDPSPTYRGVVAFYPWCGSLGGRGVVKLMAPLLILSGAKDDWVPARECEGVRSTGAELRLVTYADAGHSFDLEMMPQRYLGYLIGKDPVAAEDGRRRMVAFFRALAGLVGSVR